MTINEIRKLIRENKKTIAFIIGNGVNRYPNNPNALSWDDLLLNLWNRVSSLRLVSRPSGISLTEFYDILELENNQNIKLRKEVSNLMNLWEPNLHHRRMIRRIKELNIPILTTNYDESLAKSARLRLFKISDQGFTDFYPWSVYHGDNKWDLPTDGFGIWYINGLIKYPRSIRLGLSHYMGSVSRSRRLIHRGNEANLFTGKNISYWRGCKTWLHLIFNKSLFIFGLELEENETFLRWLLLERIKYFRKFPRRSFKGWYLYKANNNITNKGKIFFLKRVGFEMIKVDSYKDIYEDIWN